MAAHTLVHREGEARRTPRTPLFQLGWPAFWLAGGILAGMLGLIGLVFGLISGL